MRMGQGVRTGLGHGGITCVLQTQFSSFICQWVWKTVKCQGKKSRKSQGILRWVISGNPASGMMVVLYIDLNIEAL